MEGDATIQTDKTAAMPGFRFHPTEQELVGFYLRRMVEGKRIAYDVIPTVELYRYDPWELQGVARTGEKEWFFFVPRDSKFPNGGRPNRITKSGYWKATGTDKTVQAGLHESSDWLGLKKTLVFYRGRAPRGSKTDWIMNEYRLSYTKWPQPTREILKNEVTLCRIYRKNVPLKLLVRREIERANHVERLPYGRQNHLSVGEAITACCCKSEEYCSSSSESGDQRAEQAGIPRTCFISPTSKPEIKFEAPSLHRRLLMRSSMDSLDSCSQPSFGNEEWLVNHADREVGTGAGLLLQSPKPLSKSFLLPAGDQEISHGSLRLAVLRPSMLEYVENKQRDDSVQFWEANYESGETTPLDIKLWPNIRLWSPSTESFPHLVSFE